MLLDRPMNPIRSSYCSVLITLLVLLALKNKKKPIRTTLVIILSQRRTTSLVYVAQHSLLRVRENKRRIVAMVSFRAASSERILWLKFRSSFSFCKNCANLNRISNSLSRTIRWYKFYCVNGDLFQLNTEHYGLSSCLWWRVFWELRLENETCFSFLFHLPHRKAEPTLFNRESSVGRRRRQLASLNLVVRFLSRIDVHRTQDAGTNCFFEVRVGPKVQGENGKIEASQTRVKQYTEHWDWTNNQYTVRYTCIGNRTIQGMNFLRSS